MTDKNMEQNLASALAKVTPNDPNGVLSRCEPRKGKVINMMTTRRNHTFARALIAACLALAIFGGGGLAFHQANAVTSVVSLDVNPSIELEVNRTEKVLTCEALNDDARKILADMNNGADLEGTSLNVAVNAIVGALVRNGYLDSVSSAILISVEDKDQNRAANIQRKVTAAVDVILQERSSQASVLSQTVNKDPKIEEQAQQSSISTGKASLINKLLAIGGNYTFDQLAVLSVSELVDMLEVKSAALPIGKEQAKALALSYSGLDSASIIRTEVDSELDDYIPHYDVEFTTSTMEYSYEVNAYTGELLKTEQEPEDDPYDIYDDDRYDDDDDDDRFVAPPVTEPTPPPASTSDIGSDSAKAAALNHAGLSASQVTRLEVERDYDDDRLEYEIEFKYNGYEYEYTVDAATGAILEHEIDRDD